MLSYTERYTFDIYTCIILKKNNHISGHPKTLLWNSDYNIGEQSCGFGTKYQYWRVQSPMLAGTVSLPFKLLQVMTASLHQPPCPQMNEGSFILISTDRSLAIVALNSVDFYRYEISIVVVTGGVLLLYGSLVRAPLPLF